MDQPERTQKQLNDALFIAVARADIAGALAAIKEGANFTMRDEGADYAIITREKSSPLKEDPTPYELALIASPTCTIRRSEHGKTVDCTADAASPDAPQKLATILWALGGHQSYDSSREITLRHGSPEMIAFAETYFHKSPPTLAHHSALGEALAEAGFPLPTLTRHQQSLLDAHIHAIDYGTYAGFNRDTQIEQDDITGSHAHRYSEKIWGGLPRSLHYKRDLLLLMQPELIHELEEAAKSPQSFLHAPTVTLYGKNAAYAHSVTPRTRLDGIVMGDAEKYAFGNVGIAFEYRKDNNLATLRFTGGPETLRQLEPFIKDVLPMDEDHFPNKLPYKKTNTELTINNGIFSKDLATVLGRNGIDFAGKELLQENGRGGARTI